MARICGYHLKEELYNGSRTLVYRAIREDDRKPVVIKLLKNPYPNFNELVQFRNQYNIAKNLNYPRIIQTYSLENYQNSYALVMEDIQGISLLEYMLGENIASLEETLSIAVQISDIIGYIHQNRVIHKDIKPANILINPETKEIKLIDFSIASLLPKENQEIKNPNVLEGTLAYLSPEQTGRMNRGVDFRADFYAFGVTLFELLTGELPFKSDDAVELVHCHIAKQPPKIYKPHPNPLLGKEREREIPEVITNILMKLMAKNAEDRYQSALGLKYDLEFCLKQLQETGKIEDFEIAQRDICDRFIIPEKLYGREKEVEQLLAAFSRVANISPVESCNEGKEELMLVAGFSGIGKTAIVNEVHKPIVKQRGYFIKGKFDQFNRNIPLDAFVQAFKDLIAQLRTESDAQLSIWRSQILTVLGDNAQVIIDVIPELEQIIGLQTDKPLKRAIMPFGGIRVVKSSLEAYGYKLNPETEEIFTKYRKSHNDGVFDAYTSEMRLARHSGIITGLPDAYGRGRIIGDYRRVALYGVDRLINDKKEQLESLEVDAIESNIIQLREEINEQIKALFELKQMAASYGFDISLPASNAQEAVQWLYFGYLAAVKEQNGAAMSLGRVSTFLDIYFERDLQQGKVSETELQELIDHFVMKLRMVRFLRTPEYNQLFSGDPTWVTECIGGMGEDGRTLVTKNSFRILNTLYNLGAAPEPNLTVLWSERLPKAFKEFCTKVSIDTSSIQYENDDLMRPYWGDDYGIACCVSGMRIGKQMQFFGARVNLAKCLLYAINGGKDEKSGEQIAPAFAPITSEYFDYDEVIQRFDLMVDWLAKTYINMLNVIHYMHDKYCYERIEMALHDRDRKSVV